MYQVHDQLKIYSYIIKHCLHIPSYFGTLF